MGTLTLRRPAREALQLSVALLCALICACGQAKPQTPTSTTETAATPAPTDLVLTDGSAFLEVSEGTTVSLPGSDGKLALTIGAVELGKVYVTLARVNGGLWVKMKPMKPEDQVAFDYLEGNYTLNLRTLGSRDGASLARFELQAAETPSED